MQKIVSSAVVFVLLYILFMLPTYVLPFFGSNSLAGWGVFSVGADSGGLGAKAFTAVFVHLGLLLFLILLTYLRGGLLGKKWLVTFPVLAAVFDMLPVVSSIPLVPTVMHLLTIILGVSAAQAVSAPQNASSPEAANTDTGA